MARKIATIHLGFLLGYYTNEIILENPRQSSSTQKNSPNSNPRERSREREERREEGRVP
jgi:hypothetical protein